MFGSNIAQRSGLFSTPESDGDYGDRIRSCFLRGERKWTSAARISVVRYADDVVFGFQYQDEAKRFLGELGERMGRFGLALHPEKTRLIEFGRFAAENRKRRGMGKPDTSDFLGFTHICAKSCPMKRFIVRRKTAAKRLRAKLKEVKDLLRRKLHEPIPQVGAWHGSVVRGHMNYYAVPGNINSVDAFRTQVATLWLRTLRRRSQRHRLTWSRFCQSFDHFLPRSRILHHYSNDRFYAIHSKKEPSAVVPLAGICAGGAEQPAFLPQT